MKLATGGQRVKLSRIAFSTVLALFLCQNNVGADIFTIGGIGGVSHVYNPLVDPDPWNLGTSTFIAGDSSEGELIIFGGSAVQNGAGIIGNQSGVVGTATIAGSGSTWTNSQSLIVGQTGQATMEITGGGVVSNFGASVAASGSSTGTVTVSDAGSQWNSSSISVGGNSGTGTITVESDATMNSSSSTTMAVGTASTATINVNTNGTWNNSGNVSIGSRGNGTLNIDSGGVVSNVDGELATNASGTGTVSVNGAGSQWNNSSEVVIGDRGTGTLAVTSGGLVSSNRAAIGQIAGSTGTATVTGAGSTWNNTSDVFVGGSSTADGGTGTLNLLNNSQMTVGTTLKVWNNGSVNLDGGNLVVRNLDLSDASGGMSFQMLNGRLTVGNEVEGVFTQTGGTLASGSAISAIDFDSDLILNGGIAEFELSGTSRGFQYHAFDVARLALLSGTLDVNLMVGFDPVLNDSFQLIDADSYSGTPSFDFTDAALSSGLAWDTSSFLTNGTISVVGAAIPEPGSMALLLVAGMGCVLRRRR